jgi:colanic acid/amylovoran biosynthesis glycosyltransferase
MKVARLVQASSRPASRRVAHVVRRWGGASQTFVRDAVSELDRIGWEGWVLAGELEASGDGPLVRERLVRARRPPAQARVAGRLRRLPARERRARWLEPGLREIAPGVVHAHFGWAGVDAVATSRRLGLPLMVSFHGTDVNVQAGDPAKREDYRALFAGADVATVVSRALATRLRERGYDGPLAVVPAGVRLAALPLRAAPPPAGGLRLLFVGRQVEVKGLDVLIRSLPEVLAHEPAATLEVIGDGPDAGANAALAAELGVAGMIEFRGAQPHEQVFAAMRRADIAVVPSRTPATGETEGSPVFTKEAQAVGVPLVATTNGGIPETVPPAHRGLLVPEGDAAALAARILATSRDRSGWNHRISEARRFVEREFDARALAARTAELYGFAIERHAARRAAGSARPRSLAARATALGARS